jgi:glycosyltransferase involved in cell wall biosynthesis
MLFSIITPNYNGAAFLEQTIGSILAQKQDVDLEYIVVDGNSTDGSLEILDRYADSITHCIVEKDSGPACAINKGLRLATGDVVAWLNSDDLYFPGTLARVRDALQAGKTESTSMCFGGCAIIDEQGQEIRSGITTFKELFFPLSCRFTYQCINYLSQPSLFFRRHAVDNAGLLREDMTAAWDYEYILRLWHSGSAIRVKGNPLAAFRWHENSISSQHFRVQFEEEYLAARSDAGMVSLQTLFHFFVRWGIVATYKAMSGRKQNTVAGD